jgi:hypothetical protein
MLPDEIASLRRDDSGDAGLGNVQFRSTGDFLQQHRDLHFVGEIGIVEYHERGVRFRTIKG